MEIGEELEGRAAFACLLPEETYLGYYYYIQSFRHVQVAVKRKEKTTYSASQQPSTLVGIWKDH
jgi:hypothetical protein